MGRSRHTEEQKVAAVKEALAGRTSQEVAREYGISKHTVAHWKARYRGLGWSEVIQLRSENGRLKVLLDDLSRDEDLLLSANRNLLPGA